MHNTLTTAHYPKSQPDRKHKRTDKEKRAIAAHLAQLLLEAQYNESLTQEQK